MCWGRGGASLVLGFRGLGALGFSSVGNDITLKFQFSTKNSNSGYALVVIFEPEGTQLDRKKSEDIQKKNIRPWVSRTQAVALTREFDS